MSEIRVNCYAGYRADEGPSRFAIRDREFDVQELDGQWYSPDATYFRVRAHDGSHLPVLTQAVEALANPQQPRQ